jgi:hypothetical protein
MAKHNDPILQALYDGRSFTWTVPDGGDLASMRKAIKHGQTLTMSPVEDYGRIRAGDIVLLKWHNTHMMHLVGDVQGDRFLIVNSLGKINGWVSGDDLVGVITEVIEPPPRPSVSEMLDQLEVAYQVLIERESASESEAARLLSIVDDLGWYADRIGAENLDRQPRSNKWSFAQNLWAFTKQAQRTEAPEGYNPVHFFIDRGKTCVGLASEIIILFPGHG